MGVSKKQQEGIEGHKFHHKDYHPGIKCTLKMNKYTASESTTLALAIVIFTLGLFSHCTWAISLLPRQHLVA